ncbi:MAG: methionyl-tRNA formyltransferase-like protein [Candidatus Melainabacteria bacterium]|nr:MAG: methionyl-tRNA formyltransferase-like protein [Candidatus Melainabacteria bacterium]
MKNLTNRLCLATRNIQSNYFYFPIIGDDHQYRERVYCYELYHQLRRQWEDDESFTLHGEMDKAGHRYFKDTSAPKPDFIIHEPGFQNNHAVIEVKSTDSLKKGIQKDFGTLQTFLQLGYQRAIYLVYGSSVLMEKDNITAVMWSEGSKIIEVWLHAAAGEAAENVNEYA